VSRDIRVQYRIGLVSVILKQVAKLGNCLGKNVLLEASGGMTYTHSAYVLVLDEVMWAH
jgi:hypothetical protein